MSVFPQGDQMRRMHNIFVGQSYLNMLSTEQVTVEAMTLGGLPGC